MLRHWSASSHVFFYAAHIKYQQNNPSTENTLQSLVKLCDSFIEKFFVLFEGEWKQIKNPFHVSRFSILLFSTQLEDIISKQ